MPLRVVALLLSCRILGKGIETAFVKTVLRLLKEEGLADVKSKYLPTPKNGQVRCFYENIGFAVCLEAAGGAKLYNVRLVEMELETEDIYHITIK